MNDDPHFNPCDSMMEYITGEMTEEERRRFEAHVSECPSCRAELPELLEAWGALPYRMEEVEPPADLKADVMAALFPGEKQSDERFTRQVRPRPSKWLIGLTAAFVAGILIGSLSNLFVRTPAAQQAFAEPSKVEQMYSLRSFDNAMPEARGRAWLATRGDESSLVICFYELRQAKGNEAYQVWLVNGNERNNAGTFHVDAQGNGVLTYRVKKGRMPEFKSIGITLEPDPNGNAPRGPKVLGT